MKHIPDNWKEKYNSPEYDHAFGRLMDDIAEAENRRRQQNEALGCVALLLFAAVMVVGIAWVVIR